MNRSNSLTEYITILPMRVTGGLQGSPLLRQLLSVHTLTPRNSAASTSRTYRVSPSALVFGEVPSRATTQRRVSTQTGVHQRLRNDVD
jgi:hypothetical protein